MTGTRLPMFPLSTVLFPHAAIPLHVFEPRYRALMQDCLDGDRRFGVVLIERGSEVGGGDMRSSLGTCGVISKAVQLPDGRWVVQLVGEKVIEVLEWLPDDPYPIAVVAEPTVQAPARGADEDVGDLGTALELATQRVRRVRGLLAEQGGGSALAPDVPLDGAGDPDAAAWQLCAAAPVSAYDAQRLLATTAPRGRVALLTELMAELELDLHRLLSSPASSGPGEDPGADPGGSQETDD
jgi:Lon protease-like protein